MTTLNNDLHERRQHKRFLKRCEVEFSGNGLTHKGLSEDFSVKGLFIITDEDLSPGSTLDIVLHLPGGTKSNIRGRIRRVSEVPQGLGIEILEKDSNYLRFMLSFIE